MRKIKYLFCLVILLSLLTACSYVGEPDFAMFKEQFNKANRDLQLEDTNIMLEEEDNQTKYCCFFNTGKNSDYLVTVYEKKDDETVSSCTLCILKSSELNLGYIEDLFCSVLYGYNLTEEDKAKEIFKKLSLDNKTTYMAKGKTQKDFDKLNVSIIVSGAGIAITIK